VAHVRHRPKRYAFTHKHSSWLVDLDAVPQLRAPLRWFARLDPRDHYGGQPSFGSLRAAVLATLTDAGIDVSEVVRVVMLGHARSLGFVFDPMTAYWALRPDGTVAGAVVEVHNTFGQRTTYPARLDEVGRATVAKDLFVSPFNDKAGDYDMRLTLTPSRCSVSIRLDRGKGPVVSAAVSGTPIPATPASIARDLVRTPLMPVRVWVLIHLHAVALWARRLPTYLSVLRADLERTRTKRGTA
jgi:DUF1365 family protein